MKKSQIGLGAILGYMALAVQCIASVLITPFIIKNLGNSAYGTYKIITSVIAYLSVLNFGFGNATIKFLTEIKIEKDKEKERIFLSLVKDFNFLAMLLSLLVGILIYFLLPSLFSESLTPAEISLAKQLFLVLIASVVINIANDIYSAIINVNEKFIFAKGMDLFRCILRVVLIFLVLTNTKSAVSLTLIDFGLSFFMFFANVLYCRTKLSTRPRYSLHVFRKVDIQLYKPVFFYAAYYFLNLIIDQLIWNTDSVIIGMRLSSLDSAIYGAGGTISSAFYSISTVFGTLIFPKVVRFVSRGASKEQLTDLMCSVGRIQSYVSLFIVTAYFIVGSAFVTLWLSPQYQGAWLTSLLTMLGALLNAITSSGHLILRAKEKQKFFLFSYFVIFIVNAIVSYLVVIPLGINGAALVTFLSFAFATFFMILPYYHRILGIDLKRLAKNLLPPVIASALIGVCFFFAYRFFVSQISYLSIAVTLVLFALTYVFIMYALVLNQGEKAMIHGLLRSVIARKKEG